ncbi:hypothetical protein HF313_04885 [Massilia atriviolacea]|uniref:Haemolysin-type calcium binding-related domain-containing protein n=1 Tax=Massilia atriviolacea TaxID=2495579 RepID=A0A430HHL8_9BURK|nr:calcium-binding protein [Massilia atriviolacea]RSZ57002.1 hypothetical protein EJB06_22025 [Massilia atriviolacea]
MPLNTTTASSTNLNTPLNGTASNDTLNGGAADDTLNGLAGNDQLFGFAGNDILEGGTGNDFMNGGLGNDSYLFGRGDGRDIVYMTDVRPMTEVNTLRLKEGVLPSDLAFDMVGTSLLINIIGGSDQFRADGFFYGTNTTNSANPLQQIVFADGTTWNLAEIQARLYAGTEGADVRGGTYLGDAIGGLGGNDVLDGRGGDDTIEGGAGTDTLIGGLGNDQLFGGAGNDNLAGNEGNDKLDGGADDDRLDGAQGADTLDGGAGNDIVVGGLDNDLLLGNDGNDSLYGDNGDDTLDGGAGNDTLYGAFGKDTYLFGKGDGKDTIWGGMTLETGRLGTLQFKPGVLPGDVVVTPAPVGYGGVVFKLKDSADQVTIDSFLSNDDPASPYNPVQEVRFADGTRWNLAAMQAALYAGTRDADRLEGTVKGELISGQAGDDWIDAKGGDDTIDGGLGNDVIHGGLGNDTYLFGRGDGQDDIRTEEDAAPGKFNILQFKAGIAPGDVILSRYLSDLIITLKGSTDKITVTFFLNRDDIGNAFNPLQQIRFDDGTAWDAAAILAKLNGTTDGNDTISGTSGADLINGLGGADRLDGNAGNDTIDGGSGNDTVNGGAGNDTFLFGKGDGQDSITVYNGGGVDTLQFKPGVLPGDVLLEASPYSALLVKIKGSADEVKVEQFMPNHDTSTAINALQQIRFADGTTWDLATIEAQLYGGSAGADRVSGTANANTMFGLEGDDFLEGNAGNDTIDGGLGNDTIKGGGDSDTYLFGRGDGADTLMTTYDYSLGKVDVLQFKAGIAPADIRLSTSYKSLVIKIGGGTDQIKVDNFLAQDDTANAGNPLQEIRFADGTVWNLATIESLLYAGTSGAEEISGTVKGDVITGMAGADILNGNGGNDTLDGGAGNDTLNGGAGDDTFLFGKGGDDDTVTWSDAGGYDTLQFKPGILPGDVHVYAQDNALVLGFVEVHPVLSTVKFAQFMPATDTATTVHPLQQVRFADGTIWDAATLEALLSTGSNNDNTLIGLANDNHLTGLAGNDTLEGKAGNDTLDGGKGNDTISGGGGSDTVVFGLGDGWDTLRATTDSTAGKVDTLQFKAGIVPENIAFSLSGTTLRIDVKGTSDRVDVSGFLLDDNPANAGNPLQQISFADGTVWGLADMEARLYAGTANADKLSGTIKGERISGQAGADNLDGRAGNDTLDGGAGNDSLTGGTGSDTYLFGKGDGADVIAATVDATAGKVDTLQFKEGVLPADLILNSAGTALVLGIAGTADQLTVQNFPHRDASTQADTGLQQIVFADGTVWSVAAVEALLYAGTAGADTIGGSGRGDLLTGQGGADVINGYGGNDTIRGGAGDDKITTGAGDDIMLFGRGDGKDTILSGSEVSTHIDTLQFDAGIAGADLQLSASGSSLIIRIAGTSDQITVSNYISQNNRPNALSPMQRIAFADGEVWTFSKINAELLADTTPPAPPAPATTLHSMAAPGMDVGLVGVATPPLL